MADRALLGQGGRPEARWGLRAAAACAVTLVGLVLLLGSGPAPGLAPLWARLQLDRSADYCERLGGRHAALCSAYAEATSGEVKFTAAIAWRRESIESFTCANLKAECLHDDLARRVPGTFCRPLREGADCGGGRVCRGGFCGGRPADPEPQPVPRNLRQANATSETAASRQNAQLMDLSKPISAWATATATVQASRPWTRVPETFVATSHGWTRIYDYGDKRQMHAWGEVFRMLSNSPVLRIGGASQDTMTEDNVPGPEVWEALKRVQAQTGCRFIIGLPLFQKNSVDLSKQIMAAAQKALGPFIMGYELGNEPEFWPSGLGGWDKNGKWVEGFSGYADHFHRSALALNPCGTPKRLSGPGFGNLNTQDPKWTATIMYNGKDCYLWEMNNHYYPYINNVTVTPAELLSQELQDVGLDKLKEYNRLVGKEKYQIRISETNSLYGGGRPGLSDTLVGALWVADALFAFSNAGAKAFHLHWGIGGAPNGSMGQPNTGIQTNFHFDVAPGEDPVPWPSVHAPWYGYLFYVVASAGDYNQPADSQFVAANVDDKGKCGANAKVYALKADSGDLRIAVINKDVSINCNLRVVVDKQYCGKSAFVTRLLPNEDGSLTKGGLIWQGQTYDNAGYTGKLQGQKTGQWLAARAFDGGKTCGFELPVPYASAALLVAKAS